MTKIKDELVAKLAERYQRAERAQKTKILDEFIELAGCHRKHAIRVLSKPATASSERAWRGRRIYDEAMREGIGRALAHNRGEGRILPQPDHHFAPASFGFHCLLDRQRIEKLIGDDQQRPVAWQGFNRIVEMRVLDTYTLLRAQHGAGFDEMRDGREAGLLHRAQRIGGQRTAPRPQLDIIGHLRLTCALPDIGQAQADHFAEHLAYFRRGGEIARCAQRIAHGVILRVGLRHIMRQGDWPAACDTARQPLGKTQFALAKALS